MLGDTKLDRFFAKIKNLIFFEMQGLQNLEIWPNSFIMKGTSTT